MIQKRVANFVRRSLKQIVTILVVEKYIIANFEKWWQKKGNLLKKNLRCSQKIAEKKNHDFQETIAGKKIAKCAMSHGKNCKISLNDCRKRSQKDLSIDWKEISQILQFVLDKNLESP